MAKPSPDSSHPPRLLVLELWGLGDVTLALPFLRRASASLQVTLVAKPHAGPLLARFAPEVGLVPFIAPWTAFRGKYRLHRWPWRELAALRRTLRAGGFDAGISARADPRDHALLTLSGARERIGFPRAGSGRLLTKRLPCIGLMHRAEQWRALATAMGWDLPRFASESHGVRSGRRIVIHTGAGHPVRRWPIERYHALAARLRAEGWEPSLVDDTVSDLDTLVDVLSTADRFIGNDSGPGHLAALLDVPTFTIFGPQRPELFAPQHPDAAWIEGAPCEYKPCFDACRFAQPDCLLSLSVDSVWSRVQAWLARQPRT